MPYTALDYVVTNVVNGQNEHASLTWQAEVPHTQPGWYWVVVRIGGVARSTIIVHFPSSLGHPEFVVHEGTEIPIANIDCWLGPLPFPQMPEER